MTNFSVIITAGGTSSRYGGANIGEKTTSSSAVNVYKNKLLELLDDKTVIEHTVSAFLEFDEITEIIIPTNQLIKDEINSLLNDFRIKIVEGGDSRQKSVYNGLKHVNNEYVIIHDGARPLIKPGVISQVMDLVCLKDAVSVMTKTTDTIKEVDSDGKIIKTIDRSKLYNTQTPQAFKTSVITDVHEKLKDGNYTDDSSMLEELDIPVYIVNGSYTNIKITTKSDLDFAKLYI